MKESIHKSENKKKGEAEMGKEGKFQIENREGKLFLKDTFRCTKVTANVAALP